LKIQLFSPNLPAPEQNWIAWPKFLLIDST
jgi:hypothetical protein